VKQAAIADRIVLTKTDLAGAAAAELKAALRRLNPSAPIVDAADRLAPEELIAADVYDPSTKTAEVRRWLDQEAHRAADRHAHDPSRHARGIRTFCLTFERPLDWTAFGIWLTMLLHVHGRNVLRVKGLLNLRGLAAPVVIHGVQHLIHPPGHLERWPDADRRSRIVFIVRDLEPAALEASLAAFNREALRAATAA
jgi:G3E family GTPase